MTTTLALAGEQARWVRERFQRSCAELGTKVSTSDGRQRVQL